jgi:hypothetical protein
LAFSVPPPIPSARTTRFEVNIYDLDVYSELRPSAALRYMQQTASDASAAVGSTWNSTSATRRLR